MLRDGLLPTEEDPAFHQYCDLFYRYAPKSSYHVRRGYEYGFVAAKEKPYKDGSGTYAARCFPELIARHLDADPASPYWVALRFGKKSTVGCIDLDNKDHVLGHYTRRGVRRPVARLPLAHVKAIKRLYDAFPNRVWCVSSATLGLHVWARYAAPLTPAEVERRTRPRLAAIGLGGTEVYPSLQLPLQVFRRPFGLDYHTLTDDGLLSDWREQTDHFVTARRPPAFASVVRSLLELASEGWEDCNRHGGFRPRAETPFGSKRMGLNISRLRAEADEILAWLDTGCPDEPVPVSNTGAVLVPVAANAPRPPRPPATAASGRWWSKVSALARDGVPEEHKLFEYLLLLARPLIWRDYYDLDVAERVRRAEDDLLFWVATKHNGLVTRVQQGNWDDLRHEVRRQVRVAQDTTSPSLQDFYAKVRDQDRLTPHRAERVSDLIRDRHSPPPSPVCCRRISKEPDDTPLPAPVEAALARIVSDAKMRRRGGEYPFIRFARHLLNTIWEEDGAAHIHGDDLLAFCGSKNRNQVVSYKKFMTEYGLISDQWEGSAQRGVTSALYQMTDSTFEHFQQHYGTEKRVRRSKSPFTVTSLSEAKLAAVDWGWD